MRPRPGRALREQGNRLAALQGFGNRHRLILRTLAVGASYIDRVVLVAEPVDEGMSKLVLGDEGAAGRASHDDDVEPAQMLGDEQGMWPQLGAFDSHPRTEDPGNAGKETPRPGRSAKQRFRH